MISVANVTMQFGAKPLFENISVKFPDGNRNRLIGANGCGKSTLMNILCRSLEPSSVEKVSVTPNERLGKLNQDQFALEEISVIDTVIMGHAELWAVKSPSEIAATGRGVQNPLPDRLLGKDPINQQCRVGRGLAYRELSGETGTLRTHTGG